MFNPKIAESGFTWDNDSGKYIDGGNSLLIKPDRSSIITFTNGTNKQFKNLPELVDYLSGEYLNVKKNSSVTPAASTLTDPGMPVLPAVSVEPTLTEGERKYVDALVKKYNWTTYSNEYYINIIKPTTAYKIGELGGAVYILNKKDGYYNIIHNVSDNVLYTSPGFYEITTKLEHIIQDDNGNGGKDSPTVPPTEPPPTSGNQTEINELIAQVANATNKTPKEIAGAWSLGGGIKIRAIKALRRFYHDNNKTYTELFCAKIAIENWKSFLTYSAIHGFPPLENPDRFLKIITSGELPNKGSSDGPATLHGLLQEIGNAVGLTPEEVENTNFNIAVIEIKVLAIKAFRNYYVNHTLGNELVLAKSAIERWGSFVKYSELNGLPSMYNDTFQAALKYINEDKSFTNEEIEWIKAYFAQAYPHLEVEPASNGEVFINSPKSASNISEMKEGYERLFVIDKLSSSSYGISRFNKDKEIFSPKYQYNSLNELISFIGSYMTKYIPPVPENMETAQKKRWKVLFTKNHNGANLEGTKVDAQLKRAGFKWSDISQTYENTNLYQAVVITPYMGVNGYKIYWVDKKGIDKLINTTDKNEIFKYVGEDGKINKDENSDINIQSDIDVNKPTEKQISLLTNHYGFEKNSSDHDDGNLTYIKSSTDDPEHYFLLDIDTFTGEVQCKEINGGNSTGMKYSSLEDALNDFKIIFSEPDDNDKDDDDWTFDDTNDKLVELGFRYYSTPYTDHYFMNDAHTEVVVYNGDTGLIKYGINGGPSYQQLQAIKTFNNVGEFELFYTTDNNTQPPEVPQTAKGETFDSHFLKKLGFQLIEDADDKYVWRHPAGSENIVYYLDIWKNSGKVLYVSINATDDEIIEKKNFPDLNSAYEFLKEKFDLTPPAMAPYSGIDYIKLSQELSKSPFEAIRLKDPDEETLSNIGFYYKPKTIIGHKKDDKSPMYQRAYVSGTNDKMFFYGDGTVLYLPNGASEYIKFPDIKGAIQYLWGNTNWSNVPEYIKKKIKWKSKTNPIIPSTTGEMPYSGLDYSAAAKLFNYPPTHTQHLETQDEATLDSMGFKPIHDPMMEPPFQKYYQKGDNKIYFFNDGKVAFWKGDNGPFYFNTVKDGMQYIWQSNKPFIEEKLSYKGFMKEWID